ncbi:matrix metalloproteinase-21 [Plakobranchus ocellatus]|uniref:Matrix metalloproteinase-21 n=1 Tax=Plakobranchus ocellatus TaxID=259542 RepID=A0AAV4B249_9GAST|nr:matrix metalloproteinase-21 [Plakobranchus ocellatus]
MLPLRSVVVGLVRALPFLLVAVVGEPFYQRRDHQDQDNYLQPTNNDNVVKDIFDAELVLSKYGYLMCSVPRRKREAGISPHSSENLKGMTQKNSGTRSLWSGLQEGVGMDGCEKAEVQKAILNYQSTYNLPLTGELDKETMSLMSSSRCGNKDSTEDSESSSKLLDGTLVATGKHDTSTLELSQENGQGGNDVGSKGPHGQDDASKEKSSHRLWRRSANQRNSHLYSVLSGGSKSKGRPLSAHRQYLLDYIEKERAKQKQLGRSNKRIQKRWRSQLLRKYTPAERRKRSIHARLSPHRKVQDRSLMFSKDVIRWRLLDTGLSTRIPLYDQKAGISLAFRMWSEVLPVKFMEDTDSDIHDVDIEIAFGKGDHQNCEHFFDGNGGEIAHSWNVGNMHFDDDESFRGLGSVGHDGIYLLRVAVHEIGHVLGLMHTNNPDSIMYAIYRGAQMDSQFELSREDRRDMQEIYGVCKGSFDTVFDWVREMPSRHSPTFKSYFYNTYFFRNNHYWMYDNEANRTRYGDPLNIAQEWSGVPDSPDGYVHIWILFNSGTTINEAYFFKDKYYYKYNSDSDSVERSWPKLISEDFGPKPGQTVGVPDYLDSVFFDLRDKNIYFFKDDMVYVYNPTARHDEKGCCERKRTIQEEFPAAEGEKPLPSHLDAVYYSYKTKMQYFIKGDNYWRNRLFDPRQHRISNEVEYMGKWYDKWLDICDVDVHHHH